jgi:hypothetical protein
MPSTRKFRKKSYKAPSFRVINAETAKAELEAKGEPDDQQVQTMIRKVDQQLSADKRAKSKLDKPA